MGGQDDCRAVAGQQRSAAAAAAAVEVVAVAAITTSKASSRAKGGGLRYLQWSWVNNKKCQRRTFYSNCGKQKKKKKKRQPAGSSFPRYRLVKEGQRKKKVTASGILSGFVTYAAFGSASPPGNRGKVSHGRPETSGFDLLRAQCYLSTNCRHGLTMGNVMEYPGRWQGTGICLHLYGAFLSVRYMPTLGKDASQRWRFGRARGRCFEQS